MINIDNLTETELSIAYSPASTELEDVVRSAMANLLTRNLMEVQDFISVIAGILDIPDLVIPPDLDFAPIYALIKRFVRVREYNSSAEMRGLYADEVTTRRVIAAIEFNDLLYGLYLIFLTRTTLLKFGELLALRLRVFANFSMTFSIAGTDKLPNNITYSLRFPERPRLNSLYARGGSSWRTDLVFPAFEMPGPRASWSWEGGNDPGK